jgi:hypothetical protein
MSRSWWRCRNLECLVPHGAVLGRLTADDGLVLDRTVATFQVYFDTRRIIVVCPGCGTRREFRGSAVLSAREPRVGAAH